MSAKPLPFLQMEDVDIVGALAARSRYLAQVVDSMSRRRDVRVRRARLLLLLLGCSCPATGKPKVGWYVPGAIARLGAEGIRRLWATRFGVDPPSLRTIRSYLADFARVGVVIRQPGAYMPTTDPERRLRYPDTFHVAANEREAEWWVRVGFPRLEDHPAAKTSSRRWRDLVGGWRQEASQSALPGVDVGKIANAPAKRSVDEAELEGLERAALRRAPALELVDRAARVGARLRGPNRARLAQGNVERVAGACAALALQLRNEAAGRSRAPVRKRGAWLVWAFDHSTYEDLELSLRSLAREKRCKDVTEIPF